MVETGRRLPAAASVVIIGGGVMGVSAAYHLAAAGVRDVVLVERDTLGSGSTSRAAGGVRTQFSDRVNIDLAVRSRETYQHFRERFGQEIDFRPVGYLFLLDSADTVRDFERNVARQNDLGLPNRMISPEEARRLSPLITTEGLLAAAYSPMDGHCTPESVVLGFAGAARRHGAHLVTHCAATAVDVDGGEIVAVRTQGGRIRTDTVICTAGAWSRQVGEWVGVDLPVDPLRRRVVVSEPLFDQPLEIPFTIDFGTTCYYRAEGKGLLLGMSDHSETPGFKLNRTDAWLPTLSQLLQRRAPALLTAGIASGWAGLYETTPDHNALVGEAGTVGRFIYAAGFSGHGFMMGPAIGEVLRDLYLGREPFTDVGGLNADRLAGTYVRSELNIV
jgi:sarcosine oxidase, subunit beta